MATNANKRCQLILITRFSKKENYGYIPSSTAVSSWFLGKNLENNVNSQYIVSWYKVLTMKHIE